MSAHSAIATPLPTPALTEPAAPAPAPMAALTHGLAAGDEAAFREFHARYFDRLLRYHLVLARGDEQSARDALQETFTRVARRARAFDAEDAFWAWLTVIARSAAVDGRRRRSRYGTLLARCAPGWLPAPAAPEIDADAHLHEHLERALAALPAGDRRLVEAKYFSSASIRDLAAQTGATEKAVESRLRRLRQQLRENIRRSLRHEEPR